jgi:cell fate regulator YaaT (PSP1 superfamily)
MDRELERGYSENNIKNCTTNICIEDCCNKLDIYDWLKDIPKSTSQTRFVEVRFKNTRKDFFENVNELNLETGDIVAVESSPGHDIGVVSLTGELVFLQMKKLGISPKDEFKKIYRKARQADIEKWKEAISKEMKTMLRTREIARYLGLSMKIGDVEYQGDNTKAIFYYIAEERVDFRELIKIMADEFKIRVEMKQIGARQEAGRIGGIGPCGRELCCTTWMSCFSSVSTNSARHQELSLNPQKLAGQCSKLKCCLNYELGLYLDARKSFPKGNVNIKTKDGEAKHIKNDIFKQLMYYEVNIEQVIVIRAIPVKKVKEMLENNRKGVEVESIIEAEVKTNTRTIDYSDQLNSDSITRFEEKKVKKNNRRKKRRNKQ